MAAKNNKGLGIGLDVLFGGSDFDEAESELLHLPISKVEPRLEQPREYFDEDALQELADSIAPERKFLTNRSSNSNANISVILPDIKERERSQMEIAEKLSAAVRKETQARAFVQQQSTFGGRRGGMPVQYVLQAPSLEKLAEHLPEFMQKVNESPVFQMADVNLKFT